ncbi:MAG: site-2 protease family protein [Patescibacteria group bacterium]
MDSQAIDAIFFIAILIMSVVIHEVSHGFMADFLGDKTARHAGRLTLNPLHHLDLFGSIIVPVLLYYTSGFVVGWAKPVPYNPYNLRNFKWGSIAVASAGIIANIFIACIFGILIHLAPQLGMPPYDPANLYPFYKITIEIVLINLALAIFNLIPIPPLDGSKIFYPLFPVSFYPVIKIIERYHLVFLVIFIFFFSNNLAPLINYLFHLVTGLYI